MKGKAGLARWLVRLVIFGVGGIAFLFVALTPFVEMRKASIQPLTRESLAELGISMPQDAISSITSVLSGTAPTSDIAHGIASNVDVGVTTDAQDLTRLAGRPEEEDMRDFTGLYSSWWDRSFTRAYLVGLKRAETVVWKIAPESVGGFVSEIAYESSRMGDWDSAKTWFREALREETRPGMREHICGKLAWFEDDPETAATLLRYSCASDSPHRLQNATILAIVTGSDALADHYFRRWVKVEAPEQLEQWLNYGSTIPKIQDFKTRLIRERETDRANEN
jgi:hypothetical protein